MAVLAEMTAVDVAATAATVFFGFFLFSASVAVVTAALAVSDAAAANLLLSFLF